MSLLAAYEFQMFTSLLQGSDRLTRGWGHTQRALSPIRTFGIRQHQIPTLTKPFIGHQTVRTGACARVAGY